MVRIEQIFQQKISGSIREQVVLYKNEVYTYFDSGLTRHVFVNADKTKVIKFEINEHSKFNEEEISIYENASPEVRAQLARTTIEGNIIEQEFCSPIKWDNRMRTIPQIHFSNKCRGEVGWTQDGRLVCFDLDEFMKY